MFEHVKKLKIRMGMITGLYVELPMPMHEPVSFVSLRFIVKEDGEIEFDKSEGAGVSTDP